MLGGVLALLLGATGVVGGVQQALAQEASGDVVGALRSLEAQIRAMPNWELPRIEAARLRLKLGADLDLAEAHLEAARAIAPENPRVHFLYGVLMQERGRGRSALDAFEVALALRPGFDEARFRAAGQAMSLSSFQRAEAHFRAFLAEHPEAVGVQLSLAQALEAQGRAAESEKLLRRLYQQRPPVPLVAQRLADLYDRTGRPQLAEKVRRELEPSRKLRELKKSAR